jgi:hypothetical protein
MKQRLTLQQIFSSPQLRTKLVKQIFLNEVKPKAP